MALPPIVTNSSLYKVISGAAEKSQKTSGDKNASSAQGAKDTVTLSAAALQKLDEVKSTAIGTDDRARQVAGEVRDTLAQNPDFSLSAGAQDL